MPFREGFPNGRVPFCQAGNEWKEEVFRWNKSNTELKLDHDLLRELASFAENYEETSDFAVIRNKVSAPWIQGNQLISNLLHENVRGMKHLEKN